MPLVPWHRLVICSHLLLLCGGLLLAFSWSCPPPGPLFLLVLGRAFLALCLFLVFSSCCGSSVLCFSVGVSAFDFAVVFSLAFVCRLWCCGASLFAVFVVLWAAPLPRWLLSPSPLRLFPCGVLVQLLCWSLPLGIWLLHVTARLPCPNAWGVVVLCFLASSCFMAAKAFGPMWGFVLPSTPWCMCCCCALYSCAEVFILG